MYSLAREFLSWKASFGTTDQSRHFVIELLEGHRVLSVGTNSL